MNTALKGSLQRVQEALEKYNLNTQIVEYATSTRTSQEAADAIGCDLGQIVKTLIFKGKESHRPLCVLVSGKNRVEEKKVSLIVGEPIERPDAKFVELHTGFAIGGVSPVGYTFELPPLIDEDLISYPILWAAAGTPHTVFSLTPADLIRITNGQIAKIH